MASGDNVVELYELVGPSANAAPLGARSGGSTPGERDLHWAFDDTTTEYKDFGAILKGYGGSGLTFKLYWRAATATSGQVRWGVAIRRQQADTDDIDVSHTYDFNTADTTTASAAGEEVVTTITFTDGADMDSWADLERAIIRVERVGGQPAGTPMTGDAQLISLTGYET